MPTGRARMSDRKKVISPSSVERNGVSGSGEVVPSPSAMGGAGRAKREGEGKQHGRSDACPLLPPISSRRLHFCFSLYIFYIEQMYPNHLLGEWRPLCGHRASDSEYKAIPHKATKTNGNTQVYFRETKPAASWTCRTSRFGTQCQIGVLSNKGGPRHCLTGLCLWPVSATLVSSI